nr:helix-turn-helix domain-containing protein [Micromonospora sp. DSM 115978]
MRIDDSAGLGRYVRERRRDLGMTQASLAVDAGVSRRWLSDLESGKSTAEFGLVLRTLQALGLVLDAKPDLLDPGDIDLDDLLRRLQEPS